MNDKLVKVSYDKPSKLYWVKALGLSIVNLSLFISIAKMFAYYWANYVVGRNKVKIGKGSNVHPTCIFRQPELITIGDNCSSITIIYFKLERKLEKSFLETMC